MANNSMLKHDSDHLRIVQIIYAVFFTIGLMRVFETIYYSTSLKIYSIALAVAISLLGLRLFFAVEELSQYLIFRKANSKEAVHSYTITLWHYPMLLFHAFLFFWVCLSFKQTGASTDSIDIGLVYPYCFLLILNVVWLYSISQGKRISPKESVILKPLYKDHEFFWLTNNLVTAVISLFVYDKEPCGSVLVLILFVLNSLLDLSFASEQYVPK